MGSRRGLVGCWIAMPLSIGGGGRKQRLGATIRRARSSLAMLAFRLRCLVIRGLVGMRSSGQPMSIGGGVRE
jgi:hypothetical protein